MFLEANDPESEIRIYINSPGGSVGACMAIYDAINYVKCDVSTVCVGSASSAGAFILASGTKGKRYALPNSRIMIHQASGGVQGHIEDIAVTVRELNVVNKVVLDELSKITGHSIKKLKKDMERDKYMSAVEAKEYGLIDEVLVRNKEV